MPTISYIAISNQPIASSRRGVLVHPLSYPTFKRKPISVVCSGVLKLGDFVVSRILQVAQGQVLKLDSILGYA